MKSESPEHHAQPSEMHILGSDSIIDSRFDRITRLARQMFSTPLAAITLIRDGKLWCKSIDGGLLEQFNALDSVLEELSHHDELFIVGDLLEDKRLVNFTVCFQQNKVRFCAAYPIRSLDGKQIGSLAILDESPRYVDEQDLRALQDLAMLAETEVQNVVVTSAHDKLMRELDDARRAMMMDPLTGCWNRAGLEALFQHQWEFAQNTGLIFGIALVDVDNFKTINDTFGHLTGDGVLKELVNRMRDTLRTSDVIARYGGDEFLILIDTPSADMIKQVGLRLLRNIRSKPVMVDNVQIDISTSIGISIYEAGRYVNATNMLDAADKALYAAKEQGRNRVSLAKL